LLFGGAAGVSIALTAAGCRRRAPSARAVATSHPAAPPPQLRTFTAASFAALCAVCERILPRDQDPGAMDLGAPGYIDAMVAAPEHAPVREVLERNLPLLDLDAKARTGRPFSEASLAAQDQILESWQHGSERRRRFFDVALTWTLEGAFGDPKYGGNIGGRGFDMIGFRPDPPRRKMAVMPGMTHDHDASIDR
jgi:gluconate 2-dehydrogenase gamma chain